MSRPTLEVADIVRAVGDNFWDTHKSHFAWVHRKVLDAIVRCRTAPSQDDVAFRPIRNCSSAA